MHSSKMRTGRSLTVCRSLLPGGGGFALGDVSAPGGCLLGGCLLPGGGFPACTEADTPPVNRMTNRCKKYYLGHNFVAAGNKFIQIMTLKDSFTFRVINLPRSSACLLLPTAFVYIR